MDDYNLCFEYLNKMMYAPHKMTSLKMEMYRRILVFAPHCDDEAIGCGGLLLRYISMGCQVHIVYLTNEKSDKILRQNEAIDAWKKFKVVQEFWDYPDTKLSLFITEVASRMKKKLEKYNPDMILLPWPVDIHNDHKIVYSILELVDFKTDLFFYEIFHPLIANYLINITGYFFVKKSIMEAYRSQLRLNFVVTTECLNKYRAACLGIKSIKYAEAYYIVTFN